MIVGHVNADFEIVIRVDVFDSAGQTQGIEAILDTGFNGALTLPASTITQLGLSLRTHLKARVMDGGRVEIEAVP